MVARLSSSSLLPFGAYLCALTLLLIGACSQNDARTAESVVVRVANDLCQEEAKQPDEPAWVALACRVEGPASSVAHVLLPRTQWLAMRRRTPTSDAGPGK